MSAYIVDLAWSSWASVIAGGGVPVWILSVSVLHSTCPGWSWSVRVWAVNDISVPFAEEGVRASSFGSVSLAHLNWLLVLASTHYMSTGVWLEANSTWIGS